MSQQEQTSPQAQLPADAIKSAQPATPTDQKAVEDVKALQAQNDPDFAQKFAALTRKQRELFQKEQEIKQKWATVEKYEALEKLKLENPYKYIKETGLSLDSVISGALDEDKPPTVDDKVKALEEKIAAYEAKLEEQTKAQAKAQEQKTIDAFKKSVRDLITTESEKFEYITLEGDEAFETVFEVIQEHFNKTASETGQGEILEIAKAAEMVENFLEQKAIKYTQAKKLGFKLSQKSEEKPAAPEVPSEQKADDSYTLNSRATPATPPPAPRYESPEEAKARIAREFNERLKKQRGMT